MFAYCSPSRKMRNITVLSLALAWLHCQIAIAAERPGGLNFSRRCLMVNPNEGCAVADVNRDGKPDIIAETHWYAAPDFIPRPVS